LPKSKKKYKRRIHDEFKKTVGDLTGRLREEDPPETRIFP
jgi:hypothetical protein